MTDNLHISVVIVSYNVKQLLHICLHTLYNHLSTELKVEVIVVDNHSSDQTVEMIHQEFPQVVVMANTRNAGFPAANNQAFQLAKGKYIFMLNPDTEFHEDVIGKLYEKMERNPQVNLIAPKLLNSDGSLQKSVWRYPSLWTIFCEMHYLNLFLGQKNYSDKNKDLPFVAESFSGAAIFFRREVIEKIGMLDETMFWIEDTDFCYRANRAGLTLLYYPEVKLVHHIGQSAKKNYNISLSNQIFNKIKFFKKHYSKSEYLLVMLLSFYHVLFKLVVFGLLSPLKKTYALKAKAYAYTLPKVFNPPNGIV
jgi:N-acetylglucosaminyl-diphospho-decaprenol L-rhamnosyltransferase